MRATKKEKALVWAMFLIVIGLLSAITLLNSGCVPLEEDDSGELGDLLETGMTGDDILITCAYIQAELDAWQAACVDNYTEPPWFHDYVPKETPNVCAHYTGFCWRMVS